MAQARWTSWKVANVRLLLSVNQDAVSDLFVKLLTRTALSTMINALKSRRMLKTKVQWEYDNAGMTSIWLNLMIKML